MAKVAFFTHNLGYGGAQRVIVNLANEFVSRGIDVDVIIHESVGPLKSNLDDDVNVIYTETPQILPTIRRLRTYIKKVAPDALLSTVNIANLAAIMAMKTSRSDTRHVVRLANTPSRKVQEYYGRGMKHRLVPPLMRTLYPRAEQLLAVSEGLKEDLISFYGIDSSRIEVIYNPTITDAVFDLANEPVGHPWLSRSVYPVIIGVGSLRLQKDFSTAIRAFERLKREEYPNAKLVILGEGGLREDLEALVAELELTEDIDMPGTVANPYAYMARSDLFVLSSRWEGCPNVLIEALACGTQVVSTDCPHGPSEILQGGRFGTLVPPNDATGLAEGISIELGTNRDSKLLRTRSNEFSVSVIASDYQRLLLSEI